MINRHFVVVFIVSKLIEAITGNPYGGDMNVFIFIFLNTRAFSILRPHFINCTQVLIKCARKIGYKSSTGAVYKMRLLFIKCMCDL